MAKIKVVVVDDSAVVRGLIKKMLSEDAGIDVVGSASNGQIAVTTCAEVKPDVCILDIEMPVLDGIGALKKLKVECPDVKVIMCSTLTQKNAEITMAALQMGAMDTIAKPSSSSELNSKEGFQSHLIQLIKSVAIAGGGGAARKSTKVDLSVKSPSSVSMPKADIKLRPEPMVTWKPKIVMIGSSTGGPQALFNVLSHLKGKSSAPILITQHMPATFTKTLAEHITKQTGLTCFEAEQGMKVENGKAYLARGGMHMTLQKTGLDLALSLNEDAPENFCRPSVEPMFRSVMDIYPTKDILATILTGMGQDGVHASQKLADDGGYVLAQDEETSVVWGMPGAVAKAGACFSVLPLDNIGPWIAQRMS